MTAPRHRVLIQLDALWTLAEQTHDRIPRPWPDRIIIHLEYLAANMRDAVDNLRTATPDGYGNIGANTDTVTRFITGSGHSTSVEAAIVGRLDATDNGHAVGSVAVLDQLEALLRDAAALIGQALHDPDTARTRCQTASDRLRQACGIVDRWITRTQVESNLKKNLRCACGTLPGWLEWGDPLCDNIAEEGSLGLCIPCRRNREAWRVRVYRDARKQEQHR